MEYLRWILLGMGILVVAAVYLRGRAKRNARDYSPLDAANEIPSFSAREEDGAWKDGVGPVRVVHRDGTDSQAESILPEQADGDEPAEQVPWEPTDPSATVEPLDPGENTDQALDETAPQPDPQSDLQRAEPTATESTPSRDITADDVIVLYVVADRGQELKGEQILSATIATQLEYGDMNIFHRRDGNNKIVFSMANMMEPGWFDYQQMHELKTRGVSLFIQLGLCEDPVEALDDMLVCAHTLASMLNAKMCDPDRQLLNETVAKSLREKARYYYDLKHGKAEHEPG